MQILSSAPNSSTNPNAIPENNRFNLISAITNHLSALFEGAIPLPPQEDFKATWSPLHIAAANKDFHQLEVLLGQEINPNNFCADWIDGKLVRWVTPLQLALKSGSKKCFDLLFQHPHILKDVPRNHGSMLHLAIILDSPSMLEHLLHNHSAFAIPQLETRDGRGRTPMMLAAKRNHCECMTILKSHGADLCAVDGGRKTAMHLCKRVEAIMLLSLWNVSPNAKDTDNNCPVDLVRDDPTLVNLYKAINDLGMVEECSTAPFAFRAPENLVFQGGGPKGIAYVGALKFMERINALHNVKRVAGASAGAITAALLSVGYSAREVEHQLTTTNMMTFVDHPRMSSLIRNNALTMLPNIIEGNFSNVSVSDMASIVIENHHDAFQVAWNLITSGAWLPIYGTWTLIQQAKQLIDFISDPANQCPGEVFRRWIEKRVYEKTNIRHCTFKELRNLHHKDGRFKHLTVIATKLPAGTDSRTSFSSEDPRWDNVIISDAVRASMAIPFLFQAHTIHHKVQGRRVPADQPHQFIDGGCLDNFPIEESDNGAVNKSTLGFSLYTPPEPHRPSENPTYQNQVAAVFADRERLARGNDRYHRVVKISNCNASLTDFNMSEAKQRELIASGKRDTASFFGPQVLQIPREAHLYLDLFKSLFEQLNLENPNDYRAFKRWLPEAEALVRRDYDEPGTSGAEYVVRRHLARGYELGSEDRKALTQYEKTFLLARPDEKAPFLLDQMRCLGPNSLAQHFRKRQEFRQITTQGERDALVVELLQVQGHRQEYEQAIATHPSQDAKLATLHMDFGDRLKEWGEYGEAIEQYRAAFDLFSDITPPGSSANLFRLLYSIAYCQRMSGSPQAAKALIEEVALKDCGATTVSDKVAKSQALMLLGEIYHEMGEREKSDEALTRSLTLLEKHSIKGLDTAEAFTKAAEIYFDRQSYQQAADLYSQALEIHGNLQSHSALLTDPLMGIAWAHYMLGNWDAAMENAERSQEILHSINNCPLAPKADCSYFLGDVSVARGRLDEAIRYYHNARCLYEQLPDDNAKLGSVRCLYRIAHYKWETRQPRLWRPRLAREEINPSLQRALNASGQIVRENLSDADRSSLEEHIQAISGLQRDLRRRYRRHLRG